MKIKSEVLYNTMSFILTKHKNLSNNDLIIKLETFEQIHLKDFNYSPFLLPTIIELKDILKGIKNPEFMEINFYFKLKSDFIEPLFEPDMDIFSLYQLEILKDI